MTSSLASRLGEIPGVASVVIDLEGFGRGIDVRLEPDADETVVMEKLRALLAAYGVRRDRQPAMSLGREAKIDSHADPGVQVSITPTDKGARIEVATSTVKSFRVVAATPLSIAQGMADAWCQVVGRVPVEVTGVTVDVDGRLSVAASDGERETRGESAIEEGWVEALTWAVAGALEEPRVADLRKAAS